MSLNMGNITDDKTETILAFVKQIARFATSHEHSADPDDAIDVLDGLIHEARALCEERRG